MLRARHILSFLGPRARYRWLDDVYRQGLVRPSVADVGGHGSRRQYSVDDVVLLAVLWQLTLARMPKRVQRAVVQYLRSAAASAPITGIAPCMMLITDGETVTMTEPRHFAQTLATQKVLVMVPVGRLARATQRRVARLLVAGGAHV